MQKPTIGILTTLYNFDPAYSLCGVIESQLVSLVKNGYKTVLFVHDNFTDDNKVPAGVEVRKVVPRFNLVDYSDCRPVTEDFENQWKEVFSMLQRDTRDIDVMIEHDLIFQGWFLPYCVGIHQYAVMPYSPRWLHWTHSVPSPKPSGIERTQHEYRFKLPEKSRLVYLNNYSLINAAEAYGLFPKDVRVVHNPVDVRLYRNLHPLTESLIDKYGLLEADFMQTYPVSSTRMVDGKQVRVVIEVFAALKKLGKKVRLVIANAHANDKREKQVVAETLSFASERGLSPAEVIFTSLEQTPLYEAGVPRGVVSDLMGLSNLFVFPSISENCPLILLEAMMTGQILILNDNVGSMRELAGDSALYFKFGSNHDTITYQNRETYMSDVAKIINAEYQASRPLKARNRLQQSFNYDTLFKSQVEPLLYEN